MDTMCLAGTAFVASSQPLAVQRFTARSLVPQKIPVESLNGKKCDEPSLTRDEATRYVTNTGVSCGRSAEAWCESATGRATVHVTVRVRTTPARQLPRRCGTRQKI